MSDKQTEDPGSREQFQAHTSLHSQRLHHDAGEGLSKRKFRMIAIDIDGTLLNDRHQLPAKTRKAVRDAYEDGAMVVLCTGRGPANTIPIMNELGIDGYMITHNGAVHLNASGEIIHENVFHLDQVRAIIKDCRANQVHFDVNTAFDMYIESVTPLAEEMYVNFRVNPEMVNDVYDVANRKMVKLCLFGEAEEIDAAQARMDAMNWREFGSLHYIRSGHDFIDVMHDQASKGRSLLHLANKYGIAQAEIMAIGNYYNDLDMLETAGFAVAMGNSPKELKAVADVVTKTNNRNGVYHAIQAYYFENNQ